MAPSFHEDLAALVATTRRVARRDATGTTRASGYAAPRCHACHACRSYANLLAQNSTHSRLESTPLRDHFGEEPGAVLGETIVFARMRCACVFDPPTLDLAFFLEAVEERIDRSFGQFESSDAVDLIEQLDAIALTSIEH